MSMDKATQIKWALETAIDLLKTRGMEYTAILVGLTLASGEIESLRAELDDWKRQYKRLEKSSENIVQLNVKAERERNEARQEKDAWKKHAEDFETMYKDEHKALNALKRAQYDTAQPKEPCECLPAREDEANGYIAAPAECYYCRIRRQHKERTADTAQGEDKPE